MAQVLRRRGRIQVKVDKREREALIGIIDSLSPRLAAPLASAPRAYDPIWSELRRRSISSTRATAVS